MDENLQMFEFSQQSLNYMIYDCKWIPCSAKFVVVGMKANGNGVLEVYEMTDTKLEKIQQLERNSAFKCGTFGASSLRNRHMAIGDFKGRLEVMDLEQPELAIYKVQAHDDMINAMDGFGGRDTFYGPPEILTGGRDGEVKIWDIRRSGAPVVNISPQSTAECATRDCWAVTFGNSFSNDSRLVAAGFENGDLKVFDLRKLSVLWETELRNGICDIEFDRRDISMNKLAIVTLNGGLLIYDMQTHYPTCNYMCLEDRVVGRSVISNDVISKEKPTFWAVRHLPQNHNLFATCSDTGSLRLWKYQYPAGKLGVANDGYEMRIMSTITMLYSTTISSKPIHCFDWHADKMGLGVCGSFDQTVRVILTTNMNL